MHKEFLGRPFPALRPTKESVTAVIAPPYDVINLKEAKDLAKLVKKTGLLFALTHNYTGYPMVKQARMMVRNGKIGKIRKIVVEYPQGWLSTKLEDSNQKQAAWRTDPKRSGIAGAMGDIGTHAENLAEYIEIFCEKGYFSVADMERVVNAGKKHGLIPKVHVNQFNIIGGVPSAVKLGALSVDHLEVVNQEDIDALKGSITMPTLLPSCSFFLKIPYGPARNMIDQGLPICLATDYNPGSTPSGNMNFVVSLACIHMNMNPEEAINAATINGAYAMGISKTEGSIAKGKKGNIFITKKIPSYSIIPYNFGHNCIERVFINGCEFNR